MLSHQTKAGAPWCPWRDVLEGGMEMLDIISDIAALCLAGVGRGGFIALDAGALRQFVQRREVSLSLG